MVFLIGAQGFSQPVFLKELKPGSGNFTSSNGKLYYTSGDSLFKSDGTPAGTVLVKKLGEPVSLMSKATIGSNIYFVTQNGSSENLWKSDGTAANTVKVGTPKKNIIPLISYNSELYLAIDDGTRGTELWKLSATNNLSIVKDINPGGGSGYGFGGAEGEILISQNLLFFKASRGAGMELWKSNGTSAGTVLAVDFTPDDFLVYGLTDVNGVIFFTRNYFSETGTTAELWKTDGQENTSLVKAFAPSETSYDNYNISNLHELNGKLYFILDYGVPSQHLYESNGTDAGTKFVKQVNIDGIVSDMVKVNNHLVFSNNSQGFTGALWKTNGTSVGTQAFHDLDIDLNNPTVAGNMLFFVDHINATYGEANTADDFRQLWQTDLSTENTKALNQLFGTSFQGSDNVTAAGDKIFFTTFNALDPPAERKFRLWYYDPTKPSTTQPYFTLVNTDTDKDIQWLKEGDVIIKPSNLNISIRYNPATTPESVVFKLADTIRRIESGAPYLLAGDVNGNYSPWLEAKPGTHKVTAILYSQSGGKGTAGAPLIVNFTIKTETAPSAPIVNAGPDRTIDLPKDTVILNGTASDPDGRVTATYWTQVSGPNAAQIATTGNRAFISKLIAGEYKFHFIATDNDNNSSFDEVKVTVRSGPAKPEIISFTLVNASNDSDIRIINDGDGFFINDLPARSLNIKANTNGVNASKVVLKSDATTRTETVAPYSIFGDVNGDYNGGTLTVGQHTLTATPYNSSGVAGTAKTITFNVFDRNNNQPPVVNAGPDKTLTLPQNSVKLTGTATDPDGSIISMGWRQVSGPSSATLQNANTPEGTVSNLQQGQYVFEFKATDVNNASATDQTTVTVRAATGQSVTEFILVNADTDQDIRTLHEGDTLDLGTLPADLNIKVNTNPQAVGSVRIKYASINRVESQAPYSLLGDNNGNFQSGNLYANNSNFQTIEATPYTQSNAGGIAGNSLRMNLYIIPANSARLSSTDAENNMSMTAYPNPSTDYFSFSTTNTEDNLVTAEIYTSDGLKVASVLERQAVEGEQIDFFWHATGMQSGIYFCKFRSGEKEQIKKIMLK